MSLKHALLTFILFIVVAVGAVKVYKHFHRTPIHRVDPHLQWIGIVDLDNSRGANESAIFSGEQVVLVLDHASLLYQKFTKKVPKARSLSKEELFNLTNLHLFVENDENLIALGNPLFEHLLIIKFTDKGEHVDIKTLQQAGIQAIYFSKTGATEYNAVMMDGTKHMIINPNKMERS